MMSPSTEKPEWESLSPHLEEAVEKLGDRDRQAVLLRFYEQKSLPDMAAAMGVSEEGAKKRVFRAVDKLKRHFARRGFGIASALDCQRLGYSACAGRTSGAGNNNRRLQRGFDNIGLSSGDGSIGNDSQSIFHARCFDRPGSIRVGRAVPWLIVASCISHRPPTGNVVPANELKPSALAVNVSRAESSFQNLYIRDFKTIIETRKRGETEWLSTPMIYTGSAWYDGTVGGKARIYFSRHVMEWKNGAKPWFESELDESWDGTQGRDLYNPSGHGLDRRAMITAAAPVLLASRYSRYETGAAYTLQYKVNDADRVTPPGVTPPRPRHSLSGQIIESTKVGDPPEISHETVNGFQCIRLRWMNVPQETGSDTYWLDPSRGYALIKQETILNVRNTNRTETLEVTKLKSISPGIWFPLAATAVIENVGSPGSYSRYTYQAADAVANDPQWNPAIFSGPSRTAMS